MTVPAKGVAFPTSNNYAPLAGALAMLITVPLGIANVAQEFNLREEIESGQISFVQTVFIDNSANATACILKCPNTGLSITCPANSQGIFPVVTSNPPDFTLQSGTASAVVPLTFLNVPMPLLVWATTGGGSNVNITNASLLVNQSSNIATGQVSVGTSATLICAARAGRQSITIYSDTPSNADVRLGPATVTTGNGVPLIGAYGAALTLQTAAAIYGIVGAGTQNVSYIESF